MTNASLTFVIEDMTHHIILLPGDEITFGRDKTNDVKLALFPLEEMEFQWATADISRRHFSVNRKSEGYFIKDTGSTNGTSLNCIALFEKETPLQQDHIIDVGGVLDLKVHLKENTLRLYRATNTPEESYLLFSNSLTIGSSTDSIIPLRQDICAVHARFSYEDGKYFIKSCDKNAKIMVDTTSIYDQKTLPLKPKQTITIGDLNILFRVDEV